VEYLLDSPGIQAFFPGVEIPGADICKTDASGALLPPVMLNLPAAEGAKAIEKHFTDRLFLHRAAFLAFSYNSIVYRKIYTKIKQKCYR
jgi:hypothetical protein